MGGLSIRVLGDVEVAVDDVPIDVDTRKAIALVVYLAVNDTAVSRDRLAELLWGHLDSDRARGALRRTLSVLRRALNGQWLVAEGDRLRIDGDIWLDLRRSDELRESVTEHGHDREQVCVRCLDPLERAAALHRGAFMDGFALRDGTGYEAWQIEQSDTVLHRHISILRMLAEAAALHGGYDRAVEASRERVRLAPLDEAGHRQLMSMLVWAGDRAGALRQYRECVRVLDEELGVPPLPETSQLEERILCDDIPEPPAGISSFAPAPPVEAPEEGAMVGRRQELADLQRLVQAAGGRVAAITGNPGVGKSRLAEELGVWAGARSHGVAHAKAYEGEEELALVLVGEALRAAFENWESAPSLDPRAALEAARLLPELAEDDPPPPAPDPGGQSRFVDGVCSTLATLLGEGGVLILDDVQWADKASLDLLSYLVRRPKRFPICTVLIWRSSAGTRHPLQSVVEEQVGEGHGLLVELQPLSTDEVSELALRLRPEISAAANQHVAEGSSGNPLVALQYLRLIDPASGSLPDNTVIGGEVTEARLHGVGELGRQVLAAASIIGRSFTEADVRAASGRSDEETAGALDELVGSGVLVDEGGGLIDFTHDLVRQEMRESLSAVRRRLLHSRFADHLLRRSGGGPVSAAGRIAHHLEEAGRLEEAGVQRAEAGDQARAVYAHQEAMTHYQAALALGHPEAARIHTAIGDLHTLAGDYGAALESYRTSASRSSGRDLAAIEHRLGEINGRLGRWGLAVHHFQAAAAGLDEVEALIELHIDWARVCGRMGDNDGAREQAAKASELAGSGGAGLPPMVAIMEGLFDENDQSGEDRVREGMALARDRNDPGAEATALTTLALLARRRGERHEAVHRAETALSLVERIGDRHRQATLHDLLADIFHELGDEERAMTELTKAVELFSEVGTGGLEPEIWKITPW